VSARVATYVEEGRVCGAPDDLYSRAATLRAHVRRLRRWRRTRRVRRAFMTNRGDVPTRIAPEIRARRLTETPRSGTAAFLAGVHGGGGAHTIPAVTNSIPRATSRNVNAVHFRSHAHHDACAESSHHADETERVVANLNRYR